jgi:hypothetical protein
MSSKLGLCGNTTRHDTLYATWLLGLNLANVLAAVAGRALLLDGGRGAARRLEFLGPARISWINVVGKSCLLFTWEKIKQEKMYTLLF